MASVPLHLCIENYERELANAIRLGHQKRRLEVHIILDALYDRRAKLEKQVLN